MVRLVWVAASFCYWHHHVSLRCVLLCSQIPLSSQSLCHVDGVAFFRRYTPSNHVFFFPLSSTKRLGRSVTEKDADGEGKEQNLTCRLSQMSFLFKIHSLHRMQGDDEGEENKEMEM